MAKLPAPVRVKPPVSSGDKDRVTVQLAIHHQRRGDQPHTAQAMYSEILDYSEETYSRQITLGSDWTPVDTGWVPKDKVGYVFIHNQEGMNPTVRPTEEERLETANRIVQITDSTDDNSGDLIPPGTGLYRRPMNPANLRMRCLTESAKVRITVIPK